MTFSRRIWLRGFNLHTDRDISDANELKTAIRMAMRRILST
jgi:hypothetical protein